MSTPHLLGAFSHIHSRLHGVVAAFHLRGRCVTKPMDLPSLFCPFNSNGNKNNHEDPDWIPKRQFWSRNTDLKQVSLRCTRLFFDPVHWCTTEGSYYPQFSWDASRPFWRRVQIIFPARGHTCLGCLILYYMAYHIYCPGFSACSGRQEWRKNKSTSQHIGINSNCFRMIVASYGKVIVPSNMNIHIML